MATYQKPCIQCGAFVQGGARYCQACGTSNPFTHNCPTCIKEISPEHMVCSGCGRPTKILCPVCKQQTFIGKSNCEVCGESLMQTCSNPRCGEKQFFENTKCTACGKKFKKK
jgi:predicted amidophosphoribosyltransferase